MSRALLAGSCSVVIRRKSRQGPVGPISLWAVTLYQGQNVINPTLLSVAQSSNALVGHIPCTNNMDEFTNTNYEARCKTLDSTTGDPNPWLRIDYPCPQGSSVVTQVDVYPVICFPGNGGPNTCPLWDYVMDFANPAGKKDLLSYNFRHFSEYEHSIYTVPAGAGCVGHGKHRGARRMPTYQRMPWLGGAWFGLPP
jgi:hypothetical protein